MELPGLATFSLRSRAFPIMDATRHYIGILFLFFDFVTLYVVVAMPASLRNQQD